VLFVSEDAGRTFHEYATVAALGGLAIAADGRVFIADAGDPAIPAMQPGLWRAPSLAAAPQPLGESVRLSCLAYDTAADRLLACQPWTFGVLDPEDGSMQPLLDFRAVESLVSCGGSDVAAACAQQLRLAYCHISHFPCAPVCAQYADALSPETFSSLGCEEMGFPRPQPDAGAPATEPPPPNGASDVDDGGADRDAGAVERGDAAGRMPQPASGSRADGPCSALAPLGATSPGTGWACAAGLLVALVRVRRRHDRRRRAATRVQRVQRSSESSSPPPGNR
jgi:hypothetical protein